MFNIVDRTIEFYVKNLYLFNSVRFILLINKANINKALVNCFENYNFTLIFNRTLISIEILYKKNIHSDEKNFNFCPFIFIFI